MKKCGRKVDYVPLTDAEVKNVWSTFTPFVCLHGVDMEILPLHLLVWNCVHGSPSFVIFEPDKSISHPHILFFKIHVNVFLKFVPGFSRWSFSLGVTTESLYAFGLLSVQAACPTHHILSDLIIKIIGEETE